MTVVAVIFTPIVLIYQGWTYWVFRRRVDVPPRSRRDLSRAAAGPEAASSLACCRDRSGRTAGCPRRSPSRSACATARLAIAQARPAGRRDQRARSWAAPGSRRWAGRWSAARRSCSPRAPASAGPRRSSPSGSAARSSRTCRRRCSGAAVGAGPALGGGRAERRGRRCWRRAASTRSTATSRATCRSSCWRSIVPVVVVVRSLAVGRRRRAHGRRSPCR